MANEENWEGPMIKEYDKPIFLDVKSVVLNDEIMEKKYIEEMKRLCDEQPFAVLAAHGKSETSASLVAFASSSELEHVVFLTPKNTTKCDHILENNTIAMLIDNRSDYPDSINQISALTITGTATIINGGEESGKWMDLFLKKHPNLFDFADSPSTVPVVIEVKRRVFVSKFQEVFEWLKV